MKTLWAAVVAMVLAAATGGANAQGYPNKPIRIIVPFAAGGAVDTLARLIGSKLSEQLGQPVVVDNRAGAGGNLAPDALSKAAPDGYTILLTTNGLAISPSLYRTLPFDVHKDFVRGHAGRRLAACHRREPQTAGELHRRTDRARQVQSGRTELRLDRHRQSAAPDDGDAQEHSRHRHPGGALPRRRSAERRADRRRDPGRRGADGDGAAAPGERHDQGAGDRRRQALARTAQRPDRRREPSRVRIDELAGAVRARRNAPRYRADDPARNRQGAQAAGRAWRG